MSQDGKEVKSNRQLLMHVAVLNLLTIGGYTIIWFYKNWKQLNFFAREQYEKDPQRYANLRGSASTWKYLGKMKPWMHAFGILVPYYQFYLMFMFFYHVADISPKCKMAPLYLAIIFTSIIYVTMPYLQTQNFTFLIASAGVIPLVIAQDYLNAFWQSLEPADAVLRQRFTVEEFFFIAVGSAALVFYMVSFVVSPLQLLAK